MPCLSRPTSRHLWGRTEWPEPNFVRSTSKVVPEHLGPSVSLLSVTRSTPFFLSQPQSGGITPPLSSDSAKSNKRGPALPPRPGAPHEPRDKLRAHPDGLPSPREKCQNLSQGQDHPPPHPPAHLCASHSLQQAELPGPPWPPLTSQPPWAGSSLHKSRATLRLSQFSLLTFHK